MAYPFFGLIYHKKEDLFLEECFNYMYAFNIGDLGTVMEIPVPYRKWLIERWNRQKEREYKMSHPSAPSDIDRPLSQSEKKKVKNESRTVQSPAAVSDFMKQVRNK